MYSIFILPDVNIDTSCLFNGNLIYFIGLSQIYSKFVIIQTDDFYSSMWHDILFNVN